MAAQDRLDILGLLTPLRRYARSLTRSDSHAEDLVHDAIVRAYERQDSFHHGGNLRTWLFSIVHNLFIDEWRRKNSEALQVAEVAESLRGATAIDQERRLQLKQILDRFLALPDQQRAVLHLVAVEGLSYQEAATTLGIPIGTLMSRLSRARAAIRSFDEGQEKLPGVGSAEKQPALRIVGGTDE
jgi:RNA polymerase sigma factor (sigma-70 family)